MFGAFPTPSQSAIYIGEYHIDDAYSVEWELRDSSSPMYSYFRKKWVNIALGKDIVVGSLAINWRYPGYLGTALNNAQENILSMDTVSQLTRDGASYVETYLNEMRNGTAADRLVLLLQAAEDGPGALRKMSALAFAAQFSGDRDHGLDSRLKAEFPDVFDEQVTWQNQVSPVDIWTHYGDTNALHTVDIIQDVVFTGKSKQVQAGATASGGLSASGINILEVYSFFAKGVQQATIDPSNIL